LESPVNGPAAPPAPHRKVPRLDPEKSFAGASALDKLKAYLRDVPPLHARLVKVIEEQEANLARSKQALVAFDGVTAEIRAIVDRWEKDHGQPGAPAPVVPGPGAEPRG
jgi:hypothetical protein